MNERSMLLGGAQSDFARNWSREGKGLVEVLQEVVPAALDAAGIDRDELGRLRDAGRLGIFVGNFDGQQYCRQGHAGALLSEVDEVFVGVPGARYEAACASGSVALEAASTKLRCDDLDLALVVGVEVMRSVPPKEIGDYLATCALYEHEARGVDFLFPHMFGELADHVIERSGQPEARIMGAFDAIARLNHANGKRNPNAQARRFDLDSEAFARREAEFAPHLGGRTRFRDCSQITDGGAAMLVAREDYARAHARRTGRPLARLSGWGHREAPIRFDTKIEASRRGEGLLPWTQRTIADAYARAGVGPEQIDVIELHDCFTVSEFLQLSAFGLCEPGGEVELIEEGAIAPGGRCPVNPSGGLLAAGHPVGATGVRMALDLYRQVTDQAGDTQVPDARRGAMLNIGGSFTTNVSFVVEQAEA